MIVSRQKLEQLSHDTGFRREILEKVIHLLHLLRTINAHPFLRGKFVLKGGTAINLFYFDIPRLSVDIDLNYTGSLSRDKFIEERPQFEQAILDVCSREGYDVRRIPQAHAGGKWLVRYRTHSGQGGNLQIDINYMFRQPLWPSSEKDSLISGVDQTGRIPILDVHELAAGKLAALFSRQSSRDLFDSHRLLTQCDLHSDLLRIAFLVYGAINRKDWRQISMADIKYNKGEFRKELLPLLRISEPADSWEQWAKNMVTELHSGIEAVLPFTEQEIEFLDRILSNGEIRPELITDEKELIDKIRCHPGLEWKALNVLRRK